MSEKEIGTVKWFDEKKGYGFITREQGDDIFVHYKAIETTGFKKLDENQRVKFKVTHGKKGLQAEEVEKV